MFIQLAELLLGSAAGLLSLAFLARFWMQWTRTPFRNPVGQFVLVFTDWAVLPLRRIVPGLFGIDLASMLAAWLTQLAYLTLMASLAGFDHLALGGLPWLAWAALLASLRLLLSLLIFVIIVAALVSWIAPHAPAAPLFSRMADPLLAPIRRFLPVFGGLDLSPLAAVLLLQAAMIVLDHLPR
jgi:YggT family protein